MTIAVLVTGDREWTNKKAILRELSKVKGLGLVIEGGARGADRLAGEVANELKVALAVYPANWDYRYKAAGPVRNSHMLKYGKPDRVLAFHSSLEESKGTRDMVNKARRANIPVKVIRR